MKKALAILCAVGLLVLTASTLYAGGIINKNNQSADYLRTLNRAAATDLADIAVYNPAGIMLMDDGLYTKLDVMYFDKDYSNTIPPGFGIFDSQNFGRLDQDESSTIPAFFAVYKQARWAGFFAFTIPAGGGDLDYTNGNARTVALADGVGRVLNLGASGGLTDAAPYNLIRSQQEEVKKSEAYGFTVGGSYAINNQWAVSAGIRYAMAEREFDGSAVIGSTIPGVPDQELALNISEDDDGWAGIFGLNYKPVSNVNLAATLITKTEIEYEREVKKDTILPNGTPLSTALRFQDGSKIQDDIPGQLSLGASYEFFIPLKVDINYVRYFERSATIETFEDEGDSWDLGITAEYTFNPRWKASLGYLYTDIDLDDDQQIQQPEEPKLDANSIAGGVVWSPTPKWAVTLAGAFISYDVVTDSLGIEYDKEVWNISAGVQYKWF
ncbi:MAG TPA: OmpP1/FadL family transporter [Desulfobacterales bacterium]